MNQTVIAGLGASDTVNESTKYRLSDELEKIDYNDEIAVRNTLLKYEEVIAYEPIENAIVICKDGTVMRCYGTLNGVNPHEDLGDRLIGATVTHNHPVGSDNEYSFSPRDIDMFMAYDLKLLRGVDQKYIYELTRNSNNLDKPLDVEEYEVLDGEPTRHLKVMYVAEILGIGYTRKER